jgi:hypothetical protein
MQAVVYIGDRLKNYVQAGTDSARASRKGRHFYERLNR